MAVVTQSSGYVAGGMPVRVTPFPATPTEWASTYHVRWANSKQGAVARVVSPELSSPETTRAEFEFAQELGAVGIGPKVLHTDLNARVLLMEHVPGTHLTGRAATDRQLQWVADLLQRLHGLHVSNRSRLAELKTAEALKQVRRVIRGHKTMAPYAEALERYASIRKSLAVVKPNEKLCHNDLNPTNMIFGDERMWLIDFDHMGLGDPFFDLATTILSLRFDQQSEQSFLGYYFERPITAAEVRHLDLTKTSVLLRYALMTLALLPPSFDFAQAEHLRGETLPSFVFQHQAGEDFHVAVYRLSRSFLSSALGRCPS
ncbi:MULTISPECIES: phosphotransferase [unclassified Streptomyces]|uniref:phosphotransferase n=1 Tax=unclassified Streptomyces TaxID=2593676 RepID=UPI001BE99B74|nr:phosphotransferase [Streptomyces sp. McG3]MBT2896394.1 phosphotransferase [Streptomyces sp. McG3]